MISLAFSMNSRYRSSLARRTSSAACGLEDKALEPRFLSPEARDTDRLGPLRMDTPGAGRVGRRLVGLRVPASNRGDARVQANISIGVMCCQTESDLREV